MSYLSPEETAFLLKAAGIAFLAATAAMIGYVIYYYVFAGLLAPMKRQTACALLKAQRETEVDVPDTFGIWCWFALALRRILTRETTFTVYRSWDYFITFQLLDGRRLEFSVPEATYASVSEGDEGLLVYKGTIFRQFVLRRTDPGSIPQLPRV